MTDGAPALFLDTLAVLHLCLGDALGEHIDSRFELRTRPSRPLICVTSVGDVLRFANYLGLPDEELRNTQKVLKSFVQVDLRDPVVQLYGKLGSDLDKRGESLLPNKLWIAAACAASASETTKATLLTCDSDLRQFGPQFFDVEYVEKREFLTRDVF